MHSSRWKRLNALFDETVHLNAAERESFLRSSCSDDPELRRDVERLLDNDNSDTELNRAVGKIAADVFPQQSKAGEVLGTYQLVKSIGAGGMGTIWLARRNDNTYDAEVAIKLMHGIASDEHRQRFVAERQILASLNHPNIARLIDGGATDAGVPYVVMEYVEGERIDTYCQLRSVNVDDRLRLFCDLCKAVQYAHRNLIVHRDIKPANILVTDDGIAKLLDFGIAKLTGAANERLLASRETIDGASMLTPIYASPEQIRGQTISTATDVYSLGVLLYELLTGELPYEKVERDPVALAKAICEEEPRQASSCVRALGGSPIAGLSKESVVRRLAGDLDNILAKALNKNPDSRYAGAEDFADDIERHLHRIPVQARPATRRYRLQRFIDRNRRSVATTAILLAALVLATVYSVQQTRSAIAANAVAERERELTRSEVLRSTLASADALIANADPVAARRLLQSIDVNERGWEWHYLERQLDQSQGTIRGGSPVAAAVVNDNGDLLTVSTGGEVQWWRDSIELYRVQLVNSHLEESGVSLSGTTLALTTVPNRIDIWDLSSPGKPRLQSRHEVDESPRAFHVSMDGAHLAVAHTNRVAVVETRTDGRREWPVAAAAQSISMDDKGRFVLVRFGPGHSEFHRLFNSQGETLVAADSTGLSAVALSPDGEFLATADSTGTIRLREARTSRVLKRFNGHRVPATALRFSGNSEWLYSTASDLTLRAWSTGDQSSATILMGLAADPVHLVTDASGGFAATFSNDQTVQIWNREIVSSRMQFAGNWAAFMEGGEMIAAQDAFGNLRLVDSGSGEVYDRTITGNLRPSAFAANTQTGEFVIADRGDLFLVDVATLQQEHLARLDVHITDVALSTSGMIVAALQEDGNAALLRRHSDRLERVLMRHDGDAYDVAFSPDESMLAIAGQNGVALFSVGSGTLLSSLQPDGLAAHSVAFSTVDNEVATGWSDGTVRLYDLDLQRPSMTIVANVGAVTALAYSNDAIRLASGDATGGVWVLNTATRRPVFRLNTETGFAARSVAFSSDDRQLIAAGEANKLFLWDAGLARERSASAEQLRTVRERIRSRVESWIVENPHIEAVADFLRNEADLSAAERQAALQIALDPPIPPNGLTADPFDGQSIEFGGGDEHILVGNAAGLRMQKQFTLEAWIQPLAFTASQTPLSLRMLFNKEGEYQMAIDPDGRLSWTLATEHGWLGWVDTRYAAPHREWTHIAIVRDNGEVRVYLNGRLVQRQAIPDSIGDQHPYKNEFRIGGRQHTPSSFFGRIDQMRVWSLARTEADIRSAMLRPLNGDETGLLAAWNFDEDPGSVHVTDLTGGHHGVVVDAQRNSASRTTP